MSSIIFQRSGVIDVSSFERTSRESFPALKGILLIDAPREALSNYGEAVQFKTLSVRSAGTGEQSPGDHSSFDFQEAGGTLTAHSGFSRGPTSNRGEHYL